MDVETIQSVILPVLYPVSQMKLQNVYLVKIMEKKYFLRVAGTVHIFNVAKPQKRIKNHQGLAYQRGGHRQM